MKVRFWGTRGSIATPGAGTTRFGGNTSCIEVVTGSGIRFILDCGTGARPLGRAIMEEGILNHTEEIGEYLQGELEGLKKRFPVSGGEAGKTLTEKITSDAKAYLRSIAGKRNRNVAEAEKGVTESKSFTETEALGAHLVDFIARDEAELFARLQGYRVRLFSGQEITLEPRDQRVVEYRMTPREKLLATISQPNLALLLGIVGLILLYFEFTHPGFVAPGVVGGICLLMSVLGLSLLPINYVGVLLMLLAVGLFIAEVKVSGFGILGIGGLVSMVIGMLILIDSPDPAVRIGLFTALALALPFAVIFLILLVALFRSYKQKVSTGDQGMIGLTGVADTDIYRSGRARVRGEYWKAQSSAPIPAGKTVRVVDVENLMLKVEEVKE